MPIGGPAYGNTLEKIAKTKTPQAGSELLQTPGAEPARTLTQEPVPQSEAPLSSIPIEDASDDPEILNSTKEINEIIAQARTRTWEVIAPKLGAELRKLQREIRETGAASEERTKLKEEYKNVIREILGSIEGQPNEIAMLTYLLGLGVPSGDYFRGFYSYRDGFTDTQGFIVLEREEQKALGAEIVGRLYDLTLEEIEKLNGENLAVSLTSHLGIFLYPEITSMKSVDSDSVRDSIKILLEKVVGDTTNSKEADQLVNSIVGNKGSAASLQHNLNGIGILSEVQAISLEISVSKDIQNLNNVLSKDWTEAQVELKKVSDALSELQRVESIINRSKDKEVPIGETATEKLSGEYLRTLIQEIGVVEDLPKLSELLSYFRFGSHLGNLNVDLPANRELKNIILDKTISSLNKGIDLWQTSSESMPKADFFRDLIVNFVAILTKQADDTRAKSLLAAITALAKVPSLSEEVKEMLVDGLTWGAPKEVLGKYEAEYNAAKLALGSKDLLVKQRIKEPTIGEGPLTEVQMNDYENALELIKKLNSPSGFRHDAFNNARNTLSLLAKSWMGGSEFSTLTSAYQRLTQEYITALIAALQQEERLSGALVNLEGYERSKDYIELLTAEQIVQVETAIFETSLDPDKHYDITKAIIRASEKLYPLLKNLGKEAEWEASFVNKYIQQLFLQGKEDNLGKALTDLERKPLEGAASNKEALDWSLLIKKYSNYLLNEVSNDTQLNLGVKFADLAKVCSTYDRYKPLLAQIMHNLLVKVDADMGSYSPYKNNVWLLLDQMSRDLPKVSDDEKRSEIRKSLAETKLKLSLRTGINYVQDFVQEMNTSLSGLSEESKGRIVDEMLKFISDQSTYGLVSELLMSTKLDLKSTFITKVTTSADVDPKGLIYKLLKTGYDASNPYVMLGTEILYIDAERKYQLGIEKFNKALEEGTSIQDIATAFTAVDNLIAEVGQLKNNDQDEKVQELLAKFRKEIGNKLQDSDFINLDSQQIKNRNFLAILTINRSRGYTSGEWESLGSAATSWLTKRIEADLNPQSFINRVITNDLTQALSYLDKQSKGKGVSRATLEVILRVICDQLSKNTYSEEQLTSALESIGAVEPRFNRNRVPGRSFGQLAKLTSISLIAANTTVGDKRLASLFGNDRDREYVLSSIIKAVNAGLNPNK